MRLFVSQLSIDEDYSAELQDSHRANHAMPVASFEQISTVLRET